MRFNEYFHISTFISKITGNHLNGYPFHSLSKIPKRKSKEHEKEQVCNKHASHPGSYRKLPPVLHKKHMADLQGISDIPLRAFGGTVADIGVCQVVFNMCSVQGKAIKCWKSLLENYNQASLTQQREPQAKCWIFAEPAAFSLTHVPRWCKRCVTLCRWTDKAGEVHETSRVTRFWCGFVEHPVEDDPRAYRKSLDPEYCHLDFWLLNKTFGVSFNWLRRWRYRLLVHRASFQGEAAIFHLMQGPSLVQSARRNLSDAWVRHILWRRAQEATPDVRQSLQGLLLSAPIESLIAGCWHWYEPMMLMRRCTQLRLSGDRQDILAIDGNAKLHRRTCGVPFCESIYSPELDKNLLRGCSRRPHGKGTLCATHSKFLNSDHTNATEGFKDGEICAHRLRRALHHTDDVQNLEVKVAGYCGRWQPACTVDGDKLAEYFATRADTRIKLRRMMRMTLRARGARGKKQRRESSFMASWSSKGPRASSSCNTHKETVPHIAAAARTAGFLTAVSASGIVVDSDELIGAESLSQRYRFLGRLKVRLPSLRIVVHDDACHLRLMAESQEQRTPTATSLATELAYIVDEYHSSGHVGKWCAEHCLPKLPQNAPALNGFPTNICETVNSELSPLGHTVHHMGRWTCQMTLQEGLDVLNMKTLQHIAQRKRVDEKRSERKRKADQ